MEGKTLSQEYEFPEADDSPIRKYRPLRPISTNVPDSSVELSDDKHDKDNTNKSGDRMLLTDQCDIQNTDPIQNNDPMPVSHKTQCDRTPAADRPIASDVDSAPRPIALRTQRRTVYVWSDELIKSCDTMLKIPMRASMVSSLIRAYGLDRLMMKESPRPATFDELSTFHSTDYLEFLTKMSSEEDEDKYDEESNYYGLSYDCPAQSGVYEYASLVSGSTLQAAEYLKDDRCDVAINWYGGWHHGKKDSAAGFCYTNDIVLAILSLKQKFSRVLYVDLDLHHGDGVEDAFSATNKVMTMSVHKYTAGFFPGTGSLYDVGYGKGKYHCVNIPLKDGIRDQEFSTLVCRLLLKVKEKFQPDVVVCQCGADGLAGDPMESFNLTPRALGKCVHTLLSWKIPLLLLGGGGYNHANTARCWAYLTGVVLGKTLASDIPDHELIMPCWVAFSAVCFNYQIEKFLMKYGPDYTMEISAGNMKDENTAEYLQTVYTNITYNLNKLEL